MILKIQKKTNLIFVSDDFWSKKDLLTNEFTSLGFYISDHPLNEFNQIFSSIKNC